MTKIYLATPAFLGKVNIPYANSLAETAILLHDSMIPFQIHVVHAKSLIVLTRNEILQAFLKSDCTHLFCIDSDLGWPAKVVIQFLNRDVDFIGGCYPSRNDKLFRFRPSYQNDGSLVVNKSCLEMEAIPAGFMLIKRHVIEKMIADTPELAYVSKEKNKPSGHCLFNTAVINGEFWGEDYYFCQIARKSGFKILVDPTIEFNHDGFVGKLNDVLISHSPGR